MTPTRYGARRSTVSLGDEGRLDGFAIATTVPTASGDVDMIEARQLIEGGAAHAQVRRLAAAAHLHVLPIDYSLR